MGSGKSTVGRALAEAIGATFIDTDAEIERRCGKTIPEIFATDGETEFRRVEATVVADVLAGGGVVSLGGGAVMTEAVRAAVSGHDVVYLQISAAAGFARVAGSDRPLLADADPAARYAELLARREPTYRAVATVVVDADRDPATVVEDVRVGLRDGREPRSKNH
nr:shikimate kinase [Gordonia neofelifaecis]